MICLILNLPLGNYDTFCVCVVFDLNSLKLGTFFPAPVVLDRLFPVCVLGYLLIETG